MRLDRYDILILQILQQQGRITKTDLAQAINLSVSPCWERVKRLEKAGIIEGYGARINRQVLGKQTSVLVEISLTSHSASRMQHFEKTMRECEQVVDCYATGGGVDYVLRILCEGIDQYQRLIDHWLDADLGIDKYFTYIVTKTIKQTSSIPIEDSPGLLLSI
ncbi:Lrp/AsnC family transcriptional regulator [Oceanisphaera avium]|uniref:AsnC family transcriptional regulator n=1 Tax=Oceanisphaera avium TaxID=1903694 RepID=A0A1Y0CXS7_9GAMM|nr:Lrp/AsnC family transcriptional regulator [Oceanisphaera avium]ART80099.1 AsnC family transcriptional regulator [Oceanisphaera avium]